ncbi:Uma2 family endonuclease [Nodosilinea sp. LEGE 06152]|uniref:Uma2 family endonuclease n=1 Tax=Nodosilinea sp. LEGE 06152 TaxID=2777966 RepID=UPI00187F16C0|nr:Uma2 family endonuclease [Nodosilinea sp. LEGE 06152]MBE9157376.1 Uma2 family endonuclease [Nodosilinea sp. LEGE 06152]
MPTVLSSTTDQRAVYGDRTWAQFKLIQQGLEDCPGVRLFYHNRTVEVLMPGRDHEFFKSVIGFLLELFFVEQGIDFYPTGSMDQEREGEAFAQADESYCMGGPKPTPDLSIEVTFTSGNLTKLARYCVLGVPEVWFWEDGLLSLYHLETDGYRRIDRSQIAELSSLDVDLFCRCVLMAETSRLEAARAFRRGIQAG